MHRFFLVFACVLSSAATAAASYELEVTVLTVSKTTVAPGETLTFSYTVRNNGPDPSDRCTNKVDLFQPVMGYGYVFASQAMGSLERGKEFSSTYTEKAPTTVGAYIIRVTADYWSSAPITKRVKEIRITVGTPTPDLQLLSLQSRKTVAPSTEPIEFTFSVRNTGAAASGAVRNTLEILRDGVIVLAVPQDMASIPAGAEIPGSIRAGVIKEPGAYEAKLKLDSTRLPIPETDLKRVRTVKFTVRNMAIPGITVITHGWQLFGGLPLVGGSRRGHLKWPAR